MMKNNKEKNETNEQVPSVYNMSALGKIPYFIRAYVVKYWFLGVTCFFIGFGMGLVGYWYAFVGWMAYGAMYDLCVKNIFLLMDTSKKESINHIMCDKKKYYSLPINVIYAIGLFYISVIVISLINQISEGFTFGNEPFSFALVALILDAMIMGIKYSIIVIINHIKNNKQ